MPTLKKMEKVFPDLEGPLDILVRGAAILEIAREEREDAARIARGEPKFKLVRAGDIEVEDRQEEEDALLLSNPAEAAYRLAIRRIGELLYGRVGSEQAMIPTWERVAQRDRERYAWRRQIINECWDEVGDWHC
jgi:hypothetical protein